MLQGQMARHRNTLKERVYPFKTSSSVLIFRQDNHERHALSDTGCAGPLSAKVVAIYRPQFQLDQQDETHSNAGS